MWGWDRWRPQAEGQLPSADTRYRCTASSSQPGGVAIFNHFHSSENVRLYVCQKMNWLWQIASLRSGIGADFGSFGSKISGFQVSCGYKEKYNSLGLGLIELFPSIHPIMLPQYASALLLMAFGFVLFCLVLFGLGEKEEEAKTSQLKQSNRPVQKFYKIYRYYIHKHDGPQP